MKSIDRPEYVVLCQLLREVRLEAELPQSALARKMGRYQTFISDVELQRVRLDMVQLADWCGACSTDVATFARRFQDGISGMPKKRKRTAAPKLQKK